MRDVEKHSYEITAEALRSQRDAYRKYLGIVDAQRAALRSGNLAVVTGLAKHLDTVVEEIRASGRRFEPVTRTIRGGGVDGPRAQILRDLMTAAAAEAALVQLSIRDLTKRIAADRDLVAKELDDVASPGPGARTVGGPPDLPPAMIDACA